MDNKYKKHLPVAVLILLNIIFLVSFGGDFGETWDEQSRYNYAQDAIKNYLDLEPAANIGDKGPVYLVAAKLGGDLVRKIQPGLTPIQSWHYIHAFTFILGLIAFYNLCLRFLKPTASLLTTILFNTQPVLFGHSFINPRDIPFMAFFLMSIAVGMRMVDQIAFSSKHKNDQREEAPIREVIATDWSDLSRPKRYQSVMVGLLSLILPATLVFYAETVQIWVTKSITSLEEGTIFSILNYLAFLLFKGNIYGGVTLKNVKAVYPYGLMVFFIGLLGFFLICTAVYFPRSFRRLSGFQSWSKFKIKLKEIANLPIVYLSALVLGIATSNRSLSLAAGFLVLLMIWLKDRNYLFPTAIPYLGTTIMMSYLTWPGLWGNPILGLLKSLYQVSDFSWGGKTLFWGSALGSEALPKTYIPTLISIQLTIPALLFFLIGLFTLKDYKAFHEGKKRMVILFAGWLILPLSSALIIEPATYDNFRHYFFMIPPVFFFAGLGLEAILNKIQNPFLNVALAAALLFPGIRGIVTLHPYQYIYYNGFIGGVRGAYGTFETDYWGSSYPECARYINQVAPKNATVAVSGPAHIVENHARDDLTIIKYRDSDARRILEEADYAVIFSRGNRHFYLLNDHPVIYSVSRDGATLSVIRKITTDG